MKKTAVLIAVLLFPFAAGAYSWNEDAGCRAGRPIRSHVGNIAMNEISFPTGSAVENAFIEAQKEDSFATAGSFWRQGHTKYNSPWITTNNGHSEAAFTSFAPLGLSQFAGETITQYTSAWSWAHWCVYYDYIGEADVILNSDLSPWNPDLLADAPGQPEKAIAQHELLHSAGLEHEARVVATMGAGNFAYFGTNRDVQLLHSDDKAGLRFLYGNATTGTDVAVTAWKQVNFMPQYGAIAPVAVSAVVARPNQGFVEATIENHGTATVDTDLAVYLRVPPAGAWMKVETYTMKGVPAGYVWTWPLFFDTAGVAPGTYDIRVVINDSGALNEGINTVNNDFIAPAQIIVQ